MTGGRCPRKPGFVWVNRSTGEMAPARCRANFCTHCGPINAWLVGLAIAMAGPERFVRFSLVGDDWQQVRARMKRVVYGLRSHGIAWEMAWHREANPAGTGHHVHAYQHGDYVPQALLQAVCLREGMGYPDIRRFRVKGAAVYGMKALTYGMKGMGSEAAARDFLDWNGGRIVHTTRGFWRAGPGGAPLGKRAAEQLALDRLNASGHAEGDWVLTAKGVA